MKTKINEEVLSVLRKKNNTNQIEIGYIDIINPFKSIIDKFVDICNKPETTIQHIVSFIQNTKEFNQLTAQYRYCVSLSSPFQAFSANNQNTIKDLNHDYQLILFNKQENKETYNINNDVVKLKTDIKNKYILWSHAYSINKTYRLCHEDKSILTFSHRIDGWSNPVYQLTPNFSVEIKTNFGYGNASYFYTKLKYKNIDITPFSEWIDYEFARFSEIIRYTRSYILKNESWFEAMEFSRDACNLSLTDEVKFVEIHIIDECEKMVNGLEELFYKEHFTFKNRGNKESSVDKKGHILIEYRGEKISGALDFISKIIEFKKIASINSFIDRIEDSNRRIQPILVEESEILKIKINNLNQEKNELYPKYNEVLKINQDYTTRRAKLQTEITTKIQSSTNRIDINKTLETAFATRYPEYIAFCKTFKIVNESYRIITEKIKNNTKIRNNIISYNKKITTYFDK